MANHIREYMNTRCVLLTKTIKEIKKRIAQFPEGSINIKHIGGGYYYYQYGKQSGQKYLFKTDKDTIATYIQKDYLQKVMRAARAEQNALLKMQEMYPETLAEDVYDQLPESRKQFATPIVLGDEEYARQWLEKPYTRKGFPSDAPVYTTIRGERVRSKSEMIIADRLWANGIPYKYECPLMLGNKVFHPDFTMLRMSDRQILYHEHCGMMDNTDYSDDMVYRVNEYSRAGILLGDRLFLTFESSKTPLDVRMVDNLINTHFK